MLLTVLVVIGLFWSVDRFRPIFATICFLGYVAVLQWLSHVPVFQTICDHPVLTLELILAYLATGVLWSFTRWWLYIKQVFSGKRSHPSSAYSFDDIDTYRRNWINERVRDRVITARRADRIGQILASDRPLSSDATNMSAELRTEWAAHLKSIKPKAADNKGMIITWIVYWPFSALWSLLEDLIHELLKSLVMKLRTVYDYIGQMAIRDISNPR